MPSLDDLEFRIEQWDAADAHAVQLRPQARIQLRHRARVIERYEP
jgi:hypothetical protein